VSKLIEMLMYNVLFDEPLLKFSVDPVAKAKAIGTFWQVQKSRVFILFIY